MVLEDQSTVNFDGIQEICLPDDINELLRTIRNRRIIHHLQNTSAHSPSQIIDFLSSKNVMIHHLKTSCSQIPNIRCMVSDSCLLKQLFKHFKHWFLWLHPQSTQNASKIGSSVSKVYQY